MHPFKKGLLSTAVALLVCAHAYADEISYTLQSQSLKDAIELISKQSNTPYIVKGALLEGRTSKSIADIKGTKNALDAILQDSGLEARMEDGAIIIQEKESVALEGISISAQQGKGSAQEGYVAKNITGVGIWGERTLQDTPYQMSVVSQEMIENTASGIDQIFKMNPVVQVKRTSTTSGSWNTPEINIRGLEASGNHILDGIPFSWVEGVMTEELERLEILNGLSGFLYGVGYVGGSANYVTKKPTQERLANLTVGSTDNEAVYAHIDLGGKIDDEGKFTYRLNVLKQEGETSIKNQNIDRTLITGVLDWKVTDSLVLSFDASHKENKIDKLTTSPYTNQSASIFDPKQGYGPDWTFSDASQDRLGFKSLWQINDDVKLRVGYIYLEHENDMSMPYVYDNYDGTYSFNYYRSWPHTSTSQGAYLYTDFDFDTLGVEHTLTIGGSGTKTKSKSIDGAYEWVSLGNYTLDQLNSVSKPTYIGSTSNQRYVSEKSQMTNMMIGDDIRFNEQWSALVGANYAKIKKDNYNLSGDKTGGYNAHKLTPSLSLIYKPFSRLTTYATYMESLEQGTVVGSYYSNEGEVFDPYVSKQYEVGLKYTISENLLLSSALFRIEKANSYEENTASQPKLTQDGLVIHQGLEITLTGKITDNLTLVGGGTVMDLEVDKANANEGKKPTNTASKLAKLYAEYAIPEVRGLTLTGGAYYTGKSYRDDANTDTIPSYVVYDAGLRYKTKIESFPTTFILSAANIANKSYWASSSALGSPRTISLSMKMEF